MIYEVGQVAAEAAKNPGIFATGGRILIDGTIIVGMLKIAEALIAKWQRRPGGSKEKLPRPGETDICKKHLELIEGVQETVKLHGEKLAGLGEFRGNTQDSLKRIETKVDDLKDLIIGRERT
jgi:hypothetical protein